MQKFEFYFNIALDSHRALGTKFQVIPEVGIIPGVTEGLPGHMELWSVFLAPGAVDLFCGTLYVLFSLASWP